MKLVKRNETHTEVKTGKYVLETTAKSIGRTIYAKPGIGTLFYGFLYEFGIIKWGQTKRGS